MPAYVLVEVEVTDPELYERYRAIVPSTIAAHGGRYLARGGQTVTLEGDWYPRRIVILEFDSLEAAKAWWSSPEYARPKALRQQSASSRMIVVEGLAEPIL